MPILADIDELRKVKAKGKTAPAPAGPVPMPTVPGQGLPSFPLPPAPAAPAPPVAPPGQQKPFSTGTPGMRQMPTGPGDAFVSNQLAPQTGPSAPGMPPMPGAPPSAPGGGPGSIFQAGGPEQQLEYIRAHPEQFDSNLSIEQWRAWLPDLDQGCPGRKPFRTSRVGPGGGGFGGPERCVEKPDDCPEGLRIIGNGQNAKCLPQDDPVFRGGPGGPSGFPGGPGGPGSPGGPGYTTNTGGQGGGPQFNPGAGFGGIDQQLQAIISGNLTGQNSRYNPLAVQTLTGQAKAGAEDRAAMARSELEADAAARGMLGSGNTLSQLGGIRASANREVADASAGIQRAKIDADFQDRRAAIQDAFQLINDARDWAYKQQMTAMQRQQFEANLALAHARMQQEWDQMQYRTGYEFLGGGS